MLGMCVVGASAHAAGAAWFRGKGRQMSETAGQEALPPEFAEIRAAIARIPRVDIAI